MTPRVWCLFVLALFAGRLGAQPAPQSLGPVDSIALVRKPMWWCRKGPCPPERVTLRRGAIDTSVLASFERKAVSLGFYGLPAMVWGASFCRVIMSDAEMTTLSIYHREGQWSVRGYHHCSDRSPELTGLFTLELLVDSLGGTPRRRQF